MRYASVMIGICAVGGATLGVMAASGVATAQEEVREPQLVRAITEDLSEIAETVLSGRRDAYPPFDSVIAYHGDDGIGRRYLSLEGFVPPGDSHEIMSYQFTDRNPMDVRTLSYHGRSSGGVIYFLGEPDMDDLNLLTTLKTAINYWESDDVLTVNFDPPLRMNPGDAIIALIENLPSTANGITLISLHGTVPQDVGGDMMAIE